MEIHHQKQPRIYERVVESIKASIARQELQSGDPLPPERQLMEDMGVSRSSLREGFRVLELLGLIESVPGKQRCTSIFQACLSFMSCTKDFCRYFLNIGNIFTNGAITKLGLSH